MVEPLFRLAASNADSPTFGVGSFATVDAADAKHAISVRRMRVGEAIALTDGKGLRLRGAVSAIDGQIMTVTVAEVTRESEPNLAITLVQALAKGDRDELAIQAATELGAMGFLPWQAERSISRWDSSKISKGVDRWQAIVTEAAKQSLRAFDPVVAQPVTSKQLAKQISDGELGMAVVLDPTADLGLAQFMTKLNGSAAVASAFGVQRKMSLIVGPEGGISDGELASLEAAGAHRVRLGTEILRTSTAGMAAIAAIQALSGSWR
jgi:16S rRNA (uracil1498-N3)-methyltransferase